MCAGNDRTAKGSKGSSLRVKAASKRPTNTNRTAWPAVWGYWRQRVAVIEQTSRPATLEDLKTLLRSLNANGVDYLLIGGYALAAHGYHSSQVNHVSRHPPPRPH